MNPSDEAIVRAFDQAPKIIQESLSEGKAVDFMESMVSRYQLHIDTAGYVMEFIRNMLLGLLNPDQFIRKLTSVGISDDTARKLTADLNKEVFIPLRDEMRKGGSIKQPSPIPHVPIMQVSAPPLVQVPAPAPDPIPTFNLIRPQATPAVQASASPNIQTVQVPLMRTMQHDLEAVQHGMMPAPYSAPSILPSSPHPSQITPAREFQTASVPFTSIPLASKPVEVVAAQIQLPETMPPAPSAKIEPAIQTQAPKPGSDPYREPI